MTATLHITPTGSRAKYLHTPHYYISVAANTRKARPGRIERTAQECSQECFDWLLEQGINPDQITITTENEAC